ncbi:uncharacterized protein LOC120355186 [Nilaparvata lugens]|uniref:uncharacterized protein LOC120355186 n=1 Tax=Nilaparvata lugens TaxID=108931 RepID=UPI00193D4AF4|nr:uncharacterized protein LOC120355186 [Nilaparvata lugens]
MIGGVLKSTPVEWLPVLSHIPPPNLRRMNALTREYKKIQENRSLPIHEDIQDANQRRLQSRKPPVRTAITALDSGFRITEAWQQAWSAKQNIDIPFVTKRPPGFDLPRKTWNPQAAIAVSPINAKKAMKRARGLAEPAIPRTLEQMREEIMLPGREGLKTTKGGEENFLIDLAIKGDAGETLADGFASRRTVEFLRRHPGEASHVMMDATFKIIPRRPLGVHQLFSVHAIYIDIAFLLAIFLMTRKTEDSYRRVLTFVREQLAYHLACE